jgi:hypothetical protein
MRIYRIVYGLVIFGVSPSRFLGRAKGKDMEQPNKRGSKRLMRRGDPPTGLGSSRGSIEDAYCLSALYLCRNVFREQEEIHVGCDDD